MINGMYLSTMGAMVQSTRHATVANNLANANTTGFKPDWTIFRSVPAESEMQGLYRAETDAVLEKTGGGVWLERTVSDFRMGAIRQTGSPLDLTLENQTPDQVSFFMIRPGGEEGENVRYTRDGHFAVNGSGQLVTTNGDLVLDSGGAPIELGEAGLINVSANGTITEVGSNEVIGQVGVVQTPDPNKMKKLADNLYEKGNAEFQNAQGGIMTNVLEESATNSITEMVNMIEAQRIYEANMSFVRIQDESLGETVRRLGTIA